ncbi:MAG: transposase [Nitrosomonadales bacterium]|nr:transposase [Nitrosomonadales bacterium]MBL0038885.1 transposase [Nitrosomonadales bacterium]
MNLSKDEWASTSLYGVSGSFLKDWKDPGWKDIDKPLPCSGTLERVPFRNADAFVAFTGFDPRANNSGNKIGRRRLAKHGPAELHRLLNNWLDRADKLPVHDLLDRIYFEGDLLHRNVLCQCARRTTPYRPTGGV